MSQRGQRSTARHRVRLPLPLLLVGAVAVGILGMHSLVLQAAPPHAPVVHAAAATVGEHSPHPGTAGHSHHSTDTTAQAGHDGHDAALGCGGALALCIALLIGFGGFLLARGSRGWRVDGPWRARLRTVVGRPRCALSSLTPLQRTTILRC